MSSLKKINKHKLIRGQNRRWYNTFFLCSTEKYNQTPSEFSHLNTFYNTIQKRESSIHRVRCEHIAAQKAVLPDADARFSLSLLCRFMPVISPPVPSSRPWSHGQSLSSCKSPLYCIPCLQTDLCQSQKLCSSPVWCSVMFNGRWLSPVKMSPVDSGDSQPSSDGADRLQSAYRVMGSWLNYLKMTVTATKIAMATKIATAKCIHSRSKHLCCPLYLKSYILQIAP